MATVEIGYDYTSQIYGYNADYATALSTAAGHTSASSPSGTGAVGQRLIGASEVVYRSFFRFDTSSLAGNTVTKVNLSMYWNNNDTPTDFDVLILKLDWSAWYPIGTGNMDAAYDAAATAAQDNNIWRNTAGMSTSTFYASGDLDTSWVNTGGYTYYAIRSSREGTQPTTNEYIYLTSSAAMRPKLVIEYTEGVAPTGTPPRLLHHSAQPFTVYNKFTRIHHS